MMLANTIDTEAARMIRFSDQEIEKVKAAIAGGGRASDLWNGLVERCVQYTSCPQLVGPDDTKEWWYLAEDKLSSVAFVHRIRPTGQTLVWLRTLILDICGKPLDDWLGPWFRQRTVPPQGMLETAHVSIAISEAISLCPDLFTLKEQELIFASLIEKGQMPCKQWIMGRLDNPKLINNMLITMLHGYASLSALLDDKEAVNECVRYFKMCEALYNKDSYGESLEYWSYASTNLSRTYDKLVRYDTALSDQLDLMGCVKCIPWVVSSFLGTRPLAGWGDIPLPHMFNFGDSELIFRPYGDLLMQIAAWAKERAPQEAGLARWLFDSVYADTELYNTGSGTYGSFKTYQFLSLLRYADAAEPLSPQEAKLPLAGDFSVAQVIVRDKWSDGKTILGMQAGFDALSVSSHRNEDQISFILSHLDELFFVDPGRCCYRLATQALSSSTSHHNTWTFLEEHSEIPITQTKPSGNAYAPETPISRRLLVKSIDGLSVIRADCSDAYKGPIAKAERTWITAFPHVLFIIDRIDAVRPVQVRSHFILNNRDNQLKYHFGDNPYGKTALQYKTTGTHSRSSSSAETNLVFRRRDAGLKLFQVASHSETGPTSCSLELSWGYMHDFYHSLPNQPGQGAEGSTFVFTYSSNEYRKQITFVYAIAMDTKENITNWKINSTATVEESSCIYQAASPDQESGFSIRVKGDEPIVLTDQRTGKQYKIHDNDFVAIPSRT
jgi:hypothetical protein